MKKMILWGAVALIMTACAKEGTVTIRLPKDYSEKSVVVSHLSLKNIYSATSADDLKILYDTLAVNNGLAELKVDPKEASWYYVESPVPTRTQVEFYTSPGDNLDITIKSFDPLEYDIKGTELMEDIMAFYSATRPIQQEYANLISSADEIEPEKAKAIMDRYDDAVKKFVADNPDSHAIPMVIQELSGDDFKVAYDNMSAEARKSILMPGAEAFNKEVEAMQKERADEQARKEEVASGTITAPDFTLPDLSGREVSLSDFRGKWVVLDFWGSWCGWCIKGFPALKEAYEKYGDKIVVIGIDCNESEEDWKEGVKKHQIPWLNVYNGNDRALYEAYNITGFPTKAIINPEGKLVDLTTGEDPEFFTRLAAFVK